MYPADGPEVSFDVLFSWGPLIPFREENQKRTLGRVSILQLFWGAGGPGYLDFAAQGKKPMLAVPTMESRNRAKVD